MIPGTELPDAEADHDQNAPEEELAEEEEEMAEEEEEECEED